VVVYGVVLKWGLNAGWGERSDASNNPPPTARRVWSQVSGRFLPYWMWLGIVGTVWQIVSLSDATARLGAALALPVFAWIAASTWIEGQHRDGND
jgi:hypothetical protein